MVPTVGCSQAVDSPEETGATSQAITSRPAPGTVFTQTNAADHNELVEYSRASDGTLTLAATLATGGRGIGSGLTAQGALAHEGRWLFVVNAGSDDISTFDLGSSPASLVARTPSGGSRPVSVTAHDGVVYVLDAGGAGNIAGFRVDGAGALRAIPGTKLPLSGPGVTPTEVAFAPDGDTLIVTEKGGNNIDAYYVDVTGRAHGPTVTPSNGPAPFGFDFSPRGELVVSEAAESAASAYALVGEVRLDSLSASVLNTQSAACWLVVAPDGRHAFTANAGSGTLSSYAIDRQGKLTLLTAEAGVTGTGSHPVDMAFAASGGYLYSLANVAGAITAFSVDGGRLTKVGSVDSLPPSAAGLVAW